MTVDADPIIAFAKTLEGKTIYTRKQNKGFKVRVVQGDLEYTPLATGKPRIQRYKWIKRVCEQFSITNSLDRSEYSYTVHGSYLLAIIGSYVAR